jgi:hypothetical protein
MPYILPTLVAVVDTAYWRIFGPRDMRMPPKPWWNIILAAVGGLSGAYLASRLGSSDDLMNTTIGAFTGGRLLNIGYAMVNPQPFPPAKQN